MNPAVRDWLAVAHATVAPGGRSIVAVLPPHVVALQRELVHALRRHGARFELVAGGDTLIARVALPLPLSLIRELKSAT